MSSVALYRIKVPEHAAVDDSIVERWVGLAVLSHDQDFYGAVYDDAMVAWAAHWVHKDPGSGVGSSGGDAAGPVASKKTKNEAISFAVAAGSSGASTEEDLSTTVYGRLFLQLTNGRADGGPGVDFLL